MQEVFVAFASGTHFQRTIIEEAAQTASGPLRKIIPWSRHDVSGSPIQSSVESWIRSADSFVADISTPNHNVTYELGFAIGLRKPFRLIRSKRIEFIPVREIGLIDTLAHDAYDFQPDLVTIFRNDIPKNRWEDAKRIKEQPIFVLQPPRSMPWSQKTVSAIKKVARLKFRSFNPSEISRLTASELHSNVSSSFGCVFFWLDEESTAAQKHNQRTSLGFGIARALNIPCILIAHQSTSLPLDIHDLANRWDHLEQIDDLISDLRDEVLEELLNYNEEQHRGVPVGLDSINFGEPVAENEQSSLSSFFLETEAFSRARDGQTNVLIGRKGSGKSAIFLQVRDIIRSHKQNIVIDLMPEGYSLIKLKEFILEHVSYGTKKEIISAFWQYIVWLEIAYKLLEKDATKAKYDYDTMIRYQNLEQAFLARVDTGKGDFSERLQKLAENIISRFASERVSSVDGQISSSKVLEIIYGYGIRDIRDQILGYLNHKGTTFFLFDNLDRFWTPGGYTEDDAVILVGLAEAMQEIERRFRKDERDFRWVLFIRSDVYEFLVSGMADYGKLSTRSIEWSDRDQLKALFDLRIKHATSDVAAGLSLEYVSEAVICGRPVMDFVIDASMMRPRYLIRLVETARRRALTLGHAKIDEGDFTVALQELGWQVLEDLDRECRDLVPNSADLMFEILSLRDDLTASKLKYVARRCVETEAELDKLIDVLIWSGAIGVFENALPKFIFNTGYKRQYLAAIIRSQPDVRIVVHPTLCATSE